MERIRAIKTQLEKNLKLPLTPLDLKADFDYFNENLKDPLAKQMAMNWIMNKLLDNGYIVQIMENGMINVTPNEAK